MPASSRSSVGTTAGFARIACVSLLTANLLAACAGPSTDVDLAANLAQSNLNIIPKFSAAVASASAFGWWRPRADQNLSWYWQLQDALDVSHEVAVYNIDIDTPQPVINKLKARGVKLICYFSVGTVEKFRADAAGFSQEVIGEAYPGYEDERWLDLSRYNTFASVMKARLDRCAAKGFDGIEGDNIDAFNQSIPDHNGVAKIGTSFKITQQQSVDYVRWLAAESHKRGLAFGLKNAESIASDVIDYVDWMIAENCVIDGWCAEARIFIERNKPVFMAEYAENLADFSVACLQARRLGYSAIYRDTGLTARGVFKQCP